MNTTACKRLFSLGCVAHIDGAVLQITGYRPDDTVAPNYLNDGRYPALVPPGTVAAKNDGLVPVVALNCSVSRTISLPSGLHSRHLGCILLTMAAISMLTGPLAHNATPIAASSSFPATYADDFEQYDCESVVKYFTDEVNLRLLLRPFICVFCGRRAVVITLCAGRVVEFVPRSCTSRHGFLSGGDTAPD